MRWKTTTPKGIDNDDNDEPSDRPYERPVLFPDDEGLRERNADVLPNFSQTIYWGTSGLCGGWIRFNSTLGGGRDERMEGRRRTCWNRCTDWFCFSFLQGKLFVRGDSKVFRFQNGKSESLFLQRKNPRRISWTVLFRRQHRKGISEVRSSTPTHAILRFCDSATLPSFDSTISSSETIAWQDRRTTTTTRMTHVHIIEEDRMY